MGKASTHIIECVDVEAFFNRASAALLQVAKDNGLTILRQYEKNGFMFFDAEPLPGDATGEYQSITAKMYGKSPSILSSFRGESTLTVYVPEGTAKPDSVGDETP